MSILKGQSAAMTDMLMPILVAGYGRSGTTALLALLGTDSRVAFDRLYPFENRYLTYLAKYALIAGRAGPSPYVDPVQLCDFDDVRLGPTPWPPGTAGERSLMPPPAEVLAALWRAFSDSARRRNPLATHYAEKVPAWMPPLVRSSIACRTLHLVRDPRDVFVSARDFVKARGATGFGGGGELEQARHTAHGLLLFAENERADRGRDDCLRVHYEHWISNSTQVAEQLEAFLGLSLAHDESSVWRHIESHKTSGDVQRSVGRWRSASASPEAIRLLESHLYHFMRDWGYELSAEASPAAELTPERSANCSPDGALASVDEDTLITVTGPDFWFELPPDPRPASSVSEVWICLQGCTGDHCSLYWRGPRESFAEERSLHVPFQPGPHWQVLRFAVGSHRQWSGTIEQLRLDLFNGAVVPGLAGTLRWARVVM